METSTKEKLKSIERDIWKWLDGIKNNPAARYRSREDFYKKYGDGKLDRFGYGDSELAFMRWEERGVLRPPDSQPPGSEWWSNVNLWFIFLSVLGAKAYDAKLQKDILPIPSQFWYDFVAQPSASVWYRAHNSSIIDGYLKYRTLAEKEMRPEQVFVNMVLYRLLFAQAMVEGEHFAFGELGRIMANPKGFSVDLITHLQEFYPTSYPLDQTDIQAIMGRAHNVEELGVKFLDDVIILPELTKLYDDASRWNRQHQLTTFIVDHKPAYPSGKAMTADKPGCLFGILATLRKWLNM